MESQIDISNLSFNRTSKQTNDFKKYEINVDLEEESSTDTETKLRYSLDLTSKPKNSIISITGHATFSGSQDELENYLQKTDSNIPNPVVNIYEEIFPLMYIISKNMNMPSPAHTISQSSITEARDGYTETRENATISNESIKTEENKEVENTSDEPTDDANTIAQNESNDNKEPSE